MAQLVLGLVVGNNSSGVATTNDDSCAFGRGFDAVVEKSLGAACEIGELEHTSRSVPEDGLGFQDGIAVKFARFYTNVETQPAIGNAFLVSGGASISVFVEFVSGDVVNGEYNFDVPALGLFNQRGNLLRAGFVEERVADGDIFQGLFEGKGHTTSDDEGVDLVKHVLDELDLIGDLCTTEDSEEGAFGRFESLGEVLELLLHEETSSALRKLDTDHAGVSTVSSTESVIDVDVAEGGQTLAEFLDLGLVGLDLVALLVLGGTFFFDVEAKVLEKDDGAFWCLVDGLFDVRPNAIGEELDLAAKLLGDLLGYGLERIFFHDLSIRTSEVGHENHDLGLLVDGILDGG